MLKKGFFILMATFLFYGFSSAFAADFELASEVIKIIDPHINTAVRRPHVTSIYMDVRNTGKQPHDLIAAYSPLAQQVQLHITVTVNNRVTMQQIRSITIHPHHDVDLHPGGLHVMLIGLLQPLTAFQAIPLTLLFADGSWVNVDVPMPEKVY